NLLQRTTRKRIGLTRRATIALGVALLTLMAVRDASSQAPLVPGGLTALPAATLSPNLLLNGGFETVSGGLPTNWGGGTGWSGDQLVTRSGSFSYRRMTGAPSSDQSVVLRKGVYNLSGWVKTQGIGPGAAGIRLQLDFRPGG